MATKAGEKNTGQTFQDLVASGKSAEEIEKELTNPSPTPEPEKKSPEDGGMPVTPKPETETEPAPEPEPKPEDDKSEEEPVSEKDKQVAGLIRELQENRKTMKEFKEKLEEKDEVSRSQAETIAYLQGQMDKKTTETKSVLDAIPDDEPMTAGIFKKLLNEESNRAVVEQSIRENNERIAKQDRVWKETSESLRADVDKKITNGEISKELSFDNVLEKAKSICKGNKALAQAIAEAQNPAQTAYNLGLTHSDMTEILKSASKTQVIKTIKDQINQPKPKSTSPASSLTPPKLTDMPERDLYTNPKVSIEDLKKEAERLG